MTTWMNPRKLNPSAAFVSRVNVRAEEGEDTGDGSVYSGSGTSTAHRQPGAIFTIRLDESWDHEWYGIPGSVTERVVGTTAPSVTGGKVYLGRYWPGDELARFLIKEYDRRIYNLWLGTVRRYNQNVGRWWALKRRSDPDNPTESSNLEAALFLLGEAYKGLENSEKACAEAAASPKQRALIPYARELAAWLEDAQSALDLKDKLLDALDEYLAGKGR